MFGPAMAYGRSAPGVDNEEHDNKPSGGAAMSKWFLRIAMLYIVAGVGLGLAMAISGDHSMHPVHAHLALLGWVAMTLFGLFYHVMPAAAESKTAKAHFWLYVPAHFGQMVSLTIYYMGHNAVEPVLGLFSMLVGVAFLLFVVVVWQHTGKTASSA
jgi:hypothetical protein